MTFQAKLSTRPDEYPRREGHLGSGRGAAARRARDGRATATRSTRAAANFYGPKIDFDVTDAIGRKWQCATIQLDYQMPERFDLKYIGADNAEHRPVVIHRAIFGSFERFIAILIEHYAGAFPLWLAPVQADRAADCRPPPGLCRGRCRTSWQPAGLRAEVDERQEKIGYKIREAQLQKSALHAGRRRPRGSRTARCRCATAAAATRGRSSLSDFVARRRTRSSPREAAAVGELTANRS